MIKCKQCGACCKAIRLNFDLPDELKNMWVEISEKEAIEINKILIIIKAFVDIGEVKYYNCKMLKDNKCSIHATRPQICRAYPVKNALKIPTCGFFDKNDKLDAQIAIMDKVLNR